MECIALQLEHNLELSEAKLHTRQQQDHQPSKVYFAEVAIHSPSLHLWHAVASCSAERGSQ